MSDLPFDLSRMSPSEKRALLARLLQQKARQVVTPRSTDERRASLLDQFATPVEELDAEVALDPAIRPGDQPAEHPAEPAHILLTGATGFLGAFLLHELLTRTRATIHCLVRCASAEEGSRRIDRNLATYLPAGDRHPTRITPVVGDLSQPLLGLSPEQFDVLATRIDSVYHNGAAVNWISSYSRLKPTNVRGTEEILRLASHRKVKPVHVVSSLSVFPLVGNQGKVVREPDNLDHGGVLYGGYTKSKWVAEKLAAVARSRGLPVATYRPGIITGDSRTGAWNTDDFMSRLIKSWIELGTAPALDGATDMTPVDYVSTAMVELSLSEHAPGKVFHLVNPKRIHLREMVAWIRSAGYPIRELPYDRWRAELLSRAGLPTDHHAGYSLLPLFSARSPEKAARGGFRQPGPDGEGTVDQIGHVMATQYAARSVMFDDGQTRDALAGSSIACPPVDGAVFTRYLSYFARTGFLPAPRSGAGRQQPVGRLT